LFPPEKRGYQLVYHGKEREEDIIANTLAVALKKVRTFGKNGDESPPSPRWETGEGVDFDQFLNLGRSK
jgi:hypothetical protein